MTYRIQAARDEIAEIWHRNGLLAGRLGRDVLGGQENYDAFCIAKDNIQDSTDAICTLSKRGFSADPCLGYLELCGVLQTVIIQQDGIKELANALGVELPKCLAERGSHWDKLRKSRNLLSGHPNRLYNGERCVIRRQQMSFSRVHYKRVKGGSKPDHGKHQVLNLGNLLDRYDADCADFLQRGVIPAVNSL